MGGSLIAALLLASAGVVPASPPAQPQPASPGTRQCLPDRSICLQIDHGEEGAALPPQLTVFQSARGDAAEGETAIALPFALEDREWLALWPQILVLPVPAGAPEGESAHLLVGVLAGYSTMYSGGGGEAVRLHLFELARDFGRPRLAGELLDLPWSGSLMIRACFAERDMRDRRGACHDEYRFAASLDMAPQTPGQASPELTYRTSAESFPRLASRYADSSGIRLSHADLVWQADAKCTYSRQLRFNPASGRYEMDSPAPDCSDFTKP